MNNTIEDLFDIIRSRLRERPKESYTVSLADKGKPYVARKVGEEAIEVIIASTSEGKERVISETADLVYHLLVLLALEGITLDDIYQELRRRMK
ncbi:phosphoribosyl-ATP diphosphatase [Metallosphaera hakonensis]|uniref:Phosphoribosyl-ATP pyrophosphatase n=1 Tax=Metallosphaera hakonensis JCM 8857 = DSM 7519 TaxID=1293036 RepID=A0A2U9IV91_9CREN|nr:phosphoribosyl-ATP diphosphatase [Metallosphaera hakonensis]AWR99767.1 phosphoribosyl-ATP diphosphatase [Metallosphaera hakonensis JCM 8857 = DSM 7519]